MGKGVEEPQKGHSFTSLTPLPTPGCFSLPLGANLRGCPCPSDLKQFSLCQICSMTPHPSSHFYNPAAGSLCRGKEPYQNGDVPSLQKSPTNYYTAVRKTFSYYRNGNFDGFLQRVWKQTRGKETSFFNRDASCISGWAEQLKTQSGITELLTGGPPQGNITNTQSLGVPYFGRPQV